jgi:ppGpp synthetase/RelA/SpoT-type nucleotidyltranferase
MLIEKKIEYLSVTGRTKTLESALEKINRKKYGDAEDRLTDLSGVRVITYLESQVTEATDTIRLLFDVDEKNSLDRSRVLGSDKDIDQHTLFVHSGRLGKDCRNTRCSAS